jgi:hypothetical protein
MEFPMKRLTFRIWRWMVSWLKREGAPHESPLCDFPWLSEELTPGDVLLVEGRTRVGGVIKSDDAKRVIAYVVRRLGSDYDVCQPFDLARLFMPWSVLPRRWRASFFESRAGDTTCKVRYCLQTGLRDDLEDSDGFQDMPGNGQGRAGLRQFHVSIDPAAAEGA